MAMTDAEWAEYQRLGLHLRPDQRAARIAEPQMEYEVREDGVWVKAEQGTEIFGSGCLRYIKDGFGKTASPGEWRGVMSNEWAEQQVAWSNQQQAAVKKELDKRAVWGVVTLVLLILFIMMA